MRQTANPPIASEYFQVSPVENDSAVKGKLYAKLIGGKFQRFLHHDGSLHSIATCNGEPTGYFDDEAQVEQSFLIWLDGGKQGVKQ